MNDINELRKHLFETLQQIRDKENPLDIERAKAVSDVAQTIINSAKVEIDHMKMTGAASASNFIPTNENRPTLPNGNTATGRQTVQAVPGGNIVTHKLRG